MGTKAGEKTAFCQSLDWLITGPSFEWLDLTGIKRLDDDRRVVVTLVTHGTADYYCGFDVEIVSKTRGRIDKKRFLFDDYLPRADRSDVADNYPIRGNNNCFKVIAHCGWEWYIAVPTTTVPFTSAIASYVKLFQ